MKSGLLLTVFCCLIFTACSSRVVSGADIPPGSVAQATPTAAATRIPATATPPKPTAAPAQAIIAPATQTARPSATATPTHTPSPEPTATPTPVDWLKTVDRTEAQLITLGNPAAPVTMIDYSDFM